MTALTGFARQALLLDLIASLRDAGSWTGETHVQKCCYFLQEGLRVPTSFDYFLYKHGPFSFELRDLLDEMRADLLIDVEPRPPYGGMLAVTAAGRRLMEGFEPTRQRFRDQLDFVASALGDKGVAQLERLGTALYVQAEEPAASLEHLAGQIHLIKPHVSEQQAQEALQEIQRLLGQAEADRVLRDPSPNGSVPGQEPG
jgi:hypothetical protein